MAGDPLLEFIRTTTEMCEAWDSLRAMLDGSEDEYYLLDEGRIEVARRTKRMVDARKSVAKAARDMEKVLT